MKSISRQKDNIGGIARLYAVPIGLLTSLATSATPGVYAITLSSTDEVYDISAISETIEASEEEKTSAAGYYYEHQIRATIAKDTPELMLALDDLTGERLVMIFKDYNGRFKLVGSLTESIRISTKTDTGAKVSDLQKAELVFEGKTINRARYIEDPFAE
jgi:hypothetical protein